MTRGGSLRRFTVPVRGRHQALRRVLNGLVRWDG